MEMNVADELTAMKVELDTFRARCKEADEYAHKREIELEECCKKLEELTRQLENFKGQVEAYQYTLNCHR